MKSPEKITLKTLAAELGVDVSTVSLALRGVGKVAPETAARVRAHAQQRGYVPNLHAAQMAHSRQTKLSGIPVVMLTADGDKYPSLPSREGMLERAREIGYEVAVQVMPTPERARHFLRVQRARGVQGLILSGWGEESRVLADLVQDLAVVVCKRFHHELPFATVNQSHFEPLRWALCDLVRRGYRRLGVALCRHQPPLLDDHEREAAVLFSRQQFAGVAEVLPPFVGAHEDMAGFLAWYRRAQPDVVVGFHEGHLHTLRQAGVRVPEDVGFFSLHRYADSSSHGFEIADQQMGRESLSLVDKLLRHRIFGRLEDPYAIYVRPRLHLGQSLRGAPAVERDAYLGYPNSGSR